MNSDTNSFDHGGYGRVEEVLRSMPRPELPPAWRDPILHAARPPVWPWFTRPVRWGLAACWAGIAGFHLASPPGPPSSPAGALAAPPPSPVDLEQFWIAEHDGAGRNFEFPAP